MNVKTLRHWRALAVAFAAFGASSAAAIAAPTNYCDPFAGCKSHAASHYLKVSPGSVKPGKAATLHGSVGHGCKTP